VVWRHMACAADSKFSNRHVTFESNSNRDVRFEFESNLEASQVPSLMGQNITSRATAHLCFVYSCWNQERLTNSPAVFTNKTCRNLPKQYTLLDRHTCAFFLNRWLWHSYASNDNYHDLLILRHIYQNN